MVDVVTPWSLMLAAWVLELLESVGLIVGFLLVGQILFVFILAHVGSYLLLEPMFELVA